MVRVNIKTQYGLLPYDKKDVEHMEHPGCSATVYFLQPIEGFIYLKQFNRPLILRYHEAEDDPSFLHEVKILKMVAKLGHGPRLLAYDVSSRTQINEYCPNISWPGCSENPKPYFLAMRVLRSIHRKLPVLSKKYYHAPHGAIDSLYDELKDRGLPFQSMHQKIVQVMDMADQLLSAPARKVVMSHGDFHRGNILLLQDRTIKVIDWTDCRPRHAYFDIAQFTKKMSEEQQRLLLSEYLERDVTDRDWDHFNLVRCSLYCIVTLRRLSLAIKREGMGHSGEELERMVKEPSCRSRKVVTLEGDKKHLQVAAMVSYSRLLRVLETMSKIRQQEIVEVSSTGSAAGKF
ncbi:aminoglycoside phosphotransferase family protein [bacterium]|nr:aminoglycoside phosphotransferase family protein [bacterium]